MIDPSLLAAYRATCYNVPALSLVLKIDQSNQQLDQLLEKWHQNEWALITAHNPKSKICSDSENLKNHNRLEQMLANSGYNIWKSESIDPTGIWPIEYGFFTPGIELETAKSIAQEFNQMGIIYGRQNEKVRLILI